MSKSSLVILGSKVTSSISSCGFICTSKYEGSPLVYKNTNLNFCSWLNSSRFQKSFIASIPILLRIFNWRLCRLRSITVWLIYFTGPIWPRLKPVIIDGNFCSLSAVVLILTPISQLSTVSLACPLLIFEYMRHIASDSGSVVQHCPYRGSTILLIRSPNLSNNGHLSR